MWADAIRSYLALRYRLLPSLLAGGRAATEAAFPLAARCDLFWPAPEHAPFSSSNHQYLHLNDALVSAAACFADCHTNRRTCTCCVSLSGGAYLGHGGANETARSVWVPPGQWTDAWDG